MSVSVWQDRSSEMTREVDVAIVGAGLVGCAIAREASKHTSSIAILEGRTLASGGTGRGLGLALTGQPGGYSKALQRYGHARARQLWELSAENRALALHLARRYGIPVDKRGISLFGLNSAQEATLESDATAMEVDGIPVRFDHGDPTGRGFRGRLQHPEDVALDPVRLTEALLKDVRDNSAVLYEGCEVFELEPERDHVTLYGRRGTFRARHVFLATDGYTSSLVPSLGSLVTPVRLQVLATEPLPGYLPAAGYADDGQYSFRQLLDGRLLASCGGRFFGEGEHTWVEQTPFDLQEQLDAFVRKHFPETRGKVTRRWFGSLAMTLDDLPLIGQLPQDARVFFALGFGDAGLSFGLTAARAVTELAFQGTAPALFAHKRFHELMGGGPSRQQIFS